MEKKNLFTLIELLIVVAIIGILITILLPALNKAKEVSRRVVCLGNQKQIGYGLMNYSTDYDGTVPNMHVKIPFSPSNWYSDIPYQWHDELLFKPLISYGIIPEVVTCPSKSSKAAVASTMSPWIGIRFCRFFYFPATKHNTASFWHDDPISGPGYKPFTEVNKVIIAERNMYWVDQQLLDANHVLGGNASRAIGPIQLLTRIVGGNRIYSDGHGEWVRASRMGRNEDPITANWNSCRYDHSGTSKTRLYYW